MKDERRRCAYPSSFILPTSSLDSRDRRQLIPVALLAPAPLVLLGGVGADELPAHRVPLELLVVPVRQVQQVAHRHAAGADFDVADRAPPLADALDEVGVVV